MRYGRSPSLALFALVVTLEPSGSYAAPEAHRALSRVAVVPVVVASGERPALSSITGAVAGAARYRIDLSIISEEEAFVSTSELAAHVRDCGPDSSCVLGELRAVGVELGLVVVVNLDLAPPLVGLQLLDTQKGKVIAESIQRLEHGSKELGAAIRSQADAVFDRAGYEPGGRIAVRVSPERAVVRLEDGAVLDRPASSTFLLPPGRYRIRAMLDGYEDARAEVSLLARQDAEAVLQLEEKKSIFGSAWFWALIGVAAAGATTAAILATRRTDRYVCVPLSGVDCQHP